MKIKYTNNVLGTPLSVEAGTCPGRVNKVSYTRGYMMEVK